ILILLHFHHIHTLKNVQLYLFTLYGKMQFAILPVTWFPARSGLHIKRFFIWCYNQFTLYTKISIYRIKLQRFKRLDIFFSKRRLIWVSILLIHLFLKSQSIFL